MKTNTLCRQNAEILIIKSGGIESYHRTQRVNIERVIDSIPN
jgi:hypothetical protein